jgi:aryl-alcohol dehydrogenase-like predicted oxidoreductase
MLPLCADLGVGVIPWGSLARRTLTHDWDAETTTRSQTDEFGSCSGWRQRTNRITRPASDRHRRHD